MKEDPVVIVEAKRTPIGAFQGALKGFKAPELGAHVFQAVLSSVGLLVQDVIDEVLLGCALSAGVGQAPARQAMVKAGLPVHIPATTVNKVCGSGLRDHDGGRCHWGRFGPRGACRRDGKYDPCALSFR